MFRPSVQLASVVRIQHRVEDVINGQVDTDYLDAEIPLRQVHWKPFYGSEAVQAGALQITDGATVTMWYDPDVSERDRVLLNDDATKAYEVMSVENVENRGMYMQLKVRRAVNA